MNTKRKISTTNFSELMGNLIIQTGNDTDIIGFTAKKKPFEISFHGDLEDNYQLVVDDFGTDNDVFVPTEEQLTAMQNAILSKAEELQERLPEVVEYQENYGIYSQYY